MITSLDAMKVNGVVIISSFGLIPIAIRANSKASCAGVPLSKPIFLFSKRPSQINLSITSLSSDKASTSEYVQLTLDKMAYVIMFVYILLILDGVI